MKFINFFENEFFYKVFWGNTIFDYTKVLILTLILFVVLEIIKKILELKKESLLAGIMHSIKFWFLIVVGLAFSIQILHIDPAYLKYIKIILLVFAFMQFMIVFEFIFSRYIKHNKAKKDETTLHIFRIIIKIFFWAIFIVMILSNLGFEIGPLLASLGIAGVAIAFAFQKILEDVFSAFSIYFDKPFKVGDNVRVGTEMGTVDKIGIKSTRITSINGEKLVVPNKDLVNGNIANFGTMERRRIVFGLGVTYETSTAKLKKIPDIITKIFEKISDVELDNVYFKSYGDFGLNYEIIYFVSDKDYKVYAQKQHEINIKIKEQFEKNKIEFAYPTQVVYIKK